MVLSDTRTTQGFGTKTDLIDQHDCLPRRSDIESTLQGLIDLRGRNAQVTSPNDVQRFANVFGCGLSGQRLSTTRRTEEVDDEALALSLDEIVKPEVLVMSLHEGPEQLLSAGRKHKVRERFIIPLNIGCFLDVELD